MALRRDSSDQHGVYTVTEVAAALRISADTVRRKIASGELHAIEVGSGPRRQHRILARDLAAWLGPDEARAVFGLGAALESLRELFAGLSDRERQGIVDEAVAWSREGMPPRELTGRVASATDIAGRFDRSP